MWAWAVIKEATYEVMEEGLVFEEDAKKLAEELGEGYIVDLLPV
jgi:hypothetical protein